jgi:hypothetical protein
VERRDIEIFLTLVEELHFGRTAERLHVSTARVSQSIRKWERRVGAPPFEWVLLWRTSAATARVRAFTRAAQDLIRSGRATVSGYRYHH